MSLAQACILSQQLYNIAFLKSPQKIIAYLQVWKKETIVGITIARKIFCQSPEKWYFPRQLPRDRWADVNIVYIRPLYSDFCAREILTTIHKSFANPCNIRVNRLFALSLDVVLECIRRAYRRDTQWPIRYALLVWNRLKSANFTRARVCVATWLQFALLQFRRTNCRGNSCVRLYYTCIYMAEYLERPKR